MYARRLPLLAAVLCLTWPPDAARAGIHLSTMKLEPNPDLRAFLSQLRDLRSYGPTDTASFRLQANKDKSKDELTTTQRTDFLGRVAALREKEEKGRLAPDEQADLGGYLLYLKQTSTRYPPFEEAIAVLEAGFRANPRHFALAANLGTAYQLTGRLDAAQRCLEAAVDLAPEPQRSAVRLQLRLVQQRHRESLSRGRAPDLDAIFGPPAQPFRFVDETGAWNYGRLGPAEIAKLPSQSVAAAVRQLQTLLLCLPDDGRLLWQLGEWALAQGNKAVALELFNSAVDTFRLSHPTLKQHRHLLQEALHWGTIAERLGGEGKPEQWAVRIVGLGLAQALAPEGLAGVMSLVHDCAVKTEDPKLGAFFDQADDEPVAKPFVMQPWHWVLVGVGAVLGILLLIWQVQQTLGRRRLA